MNVNQMNPKSRDLESILDRPPGGRGGFVTDPKSPGKKIYVKSISQIVAKSNCPRKFVCLLGQVRKSF